MFVWHLSALVMLVMGNYSAIVPCGHLSFKPCNARLFSISIALGARIRAPTLAHFRYVVSPRIALLAVAVLDGLEHEVFKIEYCSIVGKRDTVRVSGHGLLRFVNQR